MTDLDQAIRADIDYAVQQIKGCDPNTFVAMAADELRAGLLAVLGKHRGDRIEDDEPYCAECSALAGVRMRAPCPTVLAIAKALGVETHPARYGQLGHLGDLIEEMEQIARDVERATHPDDDPWWDLPDCRRCARVATLARMPDGSFWCADCARQAPGVYEPIEGEPRP